MSQLVRVDLLAEPGLAATVVDHLADPGVRESTTAAEP